MHNNLDEDEAQEFTRVYEGHIGHGLVIFKTGFRMGVKIFYIVGITPFRTIGFFFRLGNTITSSLPIFPSEELAENIAEQTVDEEIRDHSRRN